MKNKTSKQENGNDTNRIPSFIANIAEHYGISYESAVDLYNRYGSPQLYEKLEEERKAMDEQTAGEHLESFDDLVKHENPKIALIVCLATAILSITGIVVLCVYLSQYFI